MKTDAYTSPFGHWQVTTEGDVEGRTTTNLGTFTGYIDEIALGLADKCYYSLQFTAVEDPKKAPMPTGKSVHISLGIFSPAGDLKGFERVNFFKELFKERTNIKVSEGQYYASVIISDASIVTEEEKRQQLMAKIKGTLTAEELELFQKQLK